MTELVPVLDIAAKAVRIYAESHPRPPQVNMKQAAEMLGVTRQTVSKYIASGLMRLNGAGMIPIGEVDKLLEAR